MAEFKENLLEPARALCKKEDIALDMAVLLIGNEVDRNVSIDNVLVALSEVIDCVQSAVALERQSHCQSPAVALLVELNLKASQVTVRDQEIHIRLEGTFKPFHLVLLTSQAKPAGRRVTLAEARGKMEKADFRRPYTPDVSPPPRANPSEHLRDRHLTNTLYNMTLHSNYRKLRPFSGSSSASIKDEDCFDLWVDQAEGALQEWTAAGLEETEKRRRISEALRPPASTIVRDLRLGNVQASADECIAALEAVFGTTESGEEILLKFHGMLHQEQEKPSQFLLRINSSLRRAVRKGGATPDKADYLRLQKFIRSLYDEMLLVSLRLRDMLSNPPSFIALLSQVRRYEEEVAQKRQRRPVKGRSLQALVDLPTEPQHNTVSSTMETRLTRLEHQLRDREVASTNAFQMPRTTNKLPNFCFKCGDEGHFRRRCPNPPNLASVNQKLISCLSQGNDIGHPRRSNQGPESNQAPSRAYPPRQ